jgi:hypothetical protein
MGYGAKYPSQTQNAIIITSPKVTVTMTCADLHGLPSDGYQEGSTNCILPIGFQEGTKQILRWREHRRYSRSEPGFVFW